jgi:hypothetical protein
MVILGGLILQWLRKIQRGSHVALMMTRRKVSCTTLQFVLTAPRRKVARREGIDSHMLRSCYVTGSSALPDWISALQRRWQDATPSQQAYMVVAGIAALLLLPRVVILAFVGMERLLVGLLLEIEELVVALTLKTLAAVSSAPAALCSSHELSSMVKET